MAYLVAVDSEAYDTNTRMSPEMHQRLITASPRPTRRAFPNEAERLLRRASELRPTVYKYAGSLAILATISAIGLPYDNDIATAASLGEHTVENALRATPHFEFRQYSAEQAIESTYQTYHLRDGYYVDSIASPSGYASAWSMYQLLSMYDVAHTSGINPDVNIPREQHKTLQALETYWSHAPQAFPAGFDATKTYGLGAPDRYVDDNLWMAQYFVDQYHKTGSTEYLAQTKDILDLFMSQRHNGNDAAYWKVQFPSEVNRDQCLVSNATAIPSLVEMSLLGYGGPAYQTAAEQTFDWLQQLYDPASGLYFDKIMTNGQVDTTIYTYGQGEIIESLIALNKIDPKRFPISRAATFARLSVDYFANRGGYGISKFDAIYLRSLMHIAAKTNDPVLIADTKHAMTLAKKAFLDSPTSVADAAANTTVILLAGLPFKDWATA